MSGILSDVYHRLLEHYGPQRWWPAQSPLEVLVGAILTQNTAWKNVERAIDNLREAGLLDVRRLYALPLEELAELIQPSGYYRLKAKRLHNLLQLVIDEFDGSLETMFATDREALRERLLSVNGVGPETADAIMLYAGQIPTFVVDTYTHRILARHGWTEFEADYDTIQAQFESELERDVAVFNEYHGLLVRVGNEHCRKTPKCTGCPLEPWLKNGRPLEPCE